MLKTMRKPLATCLLVALVAPGMAFAETAKEKQLEARVAELERAIGAPLPAAVPAAPVAEVK